MFKNLKIRIATAALALAPSLLFASEAAQQQQGPSQSAQQKYKLPAGLKVVTGLRPDQAQRVSNKKPKMERLRPRAESWAIQHDQEHQQARRQYWGGGGRPVPYLIVI